MKPPAIIAPAITEAEVVNRWDMATEREGRAEKTLAETRLEKGRILVAARALYPARGPKAKGWGDLLRRLRVDEDTARNYMRLAGHVDEEISRNVRETSDPLPTYADAGIVKRPAKVEPEAPREIEATPARSEVSDAQREAAYRREVDGSLPAPMEERERLTHDIVGFVADARSKLRQITERNVHLTDVTTSPEDFMRAKQMLIDIVNLCLDELASAGVLDGKEQRRQMQLLKGGIQ